MSAYRDDLAAAIARAEAAERELAATRKPPPDKSYDTVDTVVGVLVLFAVAVAVVGLVVWGPSCTREPTPDEVLTRAREIYDPLTAAQTDPVCRATARGYYICEAPGWQSIVCDTREGGCGSERLDCTLVLR